jgi:two-component system, NtrC family, response regulator AtoC
VRILLVEDDNDIRDSLSEFLQSVGHEVLERANGQKALALLKTARVHCVLSDIQMPVMGGQELLKRIKLSQTMKNIEVILFTGYGDVRGAVEAMREGAYDYLTKPVDVKELDIVLRRLGEFLSLKEENTKLLTHFTAEVEKATHDIRDELTQIRHVFAKEIGKTEIGVYSDSMKAVFRAAETLHRNPDVPVLIEGETGTGKELVAHVIHYGKGDVITPFIGINCAAISPSLFESEFFGYEPGSFTGGHPKGQKGKLELAKNGTLFLDEISEMSIEHQAKLLRLIQEREYYSVGGLKKARTEARFICATNQDVGLMAEAGTFRKDLYFRLNVGSIRIPPLRERSEDILPLAELFLARIREQKRTLFRKIGGKAAVMLGEYHWPGNVRELKNTIERIVLYFNHDEILPEHLSTCFQTVARSGAGPAAAAPIDPDAPELPENGLPLDRMVLNVVRRAFERNMGHQTRTAQYLGISVRVLQTYLKKISPRSPSSKPSGKRA